MSNLDFKLEYFGESVYIQLRSDVPTYIGLISKEDYTDMDDDYKSSFVTALFACPGVIALASQSYLVYLEKPPVFSWSEVLGPVVEQIRIATGHPTINELPGSPTYLDAAPTRRIL